MLIIITVIPSRLSCLVVRNICSDAMLKLIGEPGHYVTSVPPATRGHDITSIPPIG